MHGNVCILTESRSLTVFSGRTFRKCGHTFPIWTSGSADPAQKLLPHQHSRSPYTSWNFISQSGMLRWPVQLRIHLSNVRKFDRIAFYLRTVFLDKVLSAFRVYQQAGNAFFAIDRSSLFHQKLRIIFLNAPIISNGNVAHTLSLCVRALVAAVSRDLAIKEIMIIRYCFRSDLLSIAVPCKSTPTMLPFSPHPYFLSRKFRIFFIQVFHLFPCSV